MAYAISGKPGVDFSRVDTTAKFPLGEEQQGSDGNFYIYVGASPSTAGVGWGNILMDDFTVENLNTANSGDRPARVVWNAVATVSGDYHWAVSHGGAFEVKVLASCAADVKLYTTTTAGSMDDTATDLVEGVRLIETATGAGAYTATATGPCSVNTQS